MKTERFFNDIAQKENIILFKDTNELLKEEFKKQYIAYKDCFFYEQFMNSGGFVVDNWIRIYGCGKLNVIDKNMRYNKNKDVDIIVGEDVIGGLFGLKDGNIWYYAPDTTTWENLGIFYTEFLSWIVNMNERLEIFYKNYRWTTWKEDCKNLSLVQGFHFYPLLNFACDINERSRIAISMDEIIRFNFDL